MIAKGFGRSFASAMVLLLSALLAFGASQAMACSIPPAHQTSPHPVLVGRAETIVLARPSIQQNNGLVLFDIIETLKGDATKSQVASRGVIMASPLSAAQRILGSQVPGDFFGHKSHLFWTKGLSRNSVLPDCRIRPVFELGKTYLLFVDEEHLWASEEVLTSDDLWLLAVRRLVEDPVLTSGLSLTSSEWIELAESAFLGTVIDCNGPRLRVDVVLFGFHSESFTAGNQGAAHQRCEIGERFFVAKLTDNHIERPDLSLIIVPLIDEFADFSEVFELSEIEVLSPPRVSFGNF